jgi:hypothetical protein
VKSFFFPLSGAWKQHYKKPVSPLAAASGLACVTAGYSQKTIAAA